MDSRSHTNALALLHRRTVLHQVRRVRRNAADADSHAEVTITQATVPAVVKRLEGYVDPAVITARWDLVCTQRLSEALFADAVLLVEGDDDKAVFKELPAPTRHLAIDGISVAAAQGKGHLYVPNAILSERAFPTITVFDNDSGCAERMEAKNKNATDIRMQSVSTRTTTENFCATSVSIQSIIRWDESARAFWPCQTH